SWMRYLAHGGAEIVYARSTDDGVTWQDVKVLDNPVVGSKAEENGVIGMHILFANGWYGRESVAPGDKIIYGIDYGDRDVPKPKSKRQGSGNDYDLRLYFADSNGTRWTKPEIAIPNAFRDTGDDTDPQIA